MKQSFTEQYGPWALVVGASVGLGAAWAEECAKRGMNVAVCARRLDKLQAVTAHLREAYGVETREFTVDISREEAVDTILANIDGLDVGMCIYNAAIEHVGTFIDVDLRYHDTQIVGNALVPMRLCWHLCRDMARKHRGCILLCSSFAAVVGNPNNSVYGGVKSFEMQLAKGLWYEMRKYGVTVAGVTIGAIETPEYKRVQASQAEKMEDRAAKAGKAKEYRSFKGIAPEDAAAYVMDHVKDTPQLFTSFGFQALNKMMLLLPARKGTHIMGSTMDKNFSSGYATLESEFTEVAWD